MKTILARLKNASKQLQITSEQRNSLIMQIATSLKNSSKEILTANHMDLEANKHLSKPLIQRLKFDENSLKNLCESIMQISNSEEVLGIIKEGWTAKSGIKIEKVSVPIGNIAVIYESRPNVTAEVAALCIKSGNGCVLKGGKEAKNTNLAIVSAIHKAFMICGIKEQCVIYLDINRDDMNKLIKMDEYIDLLIPRGGEDLIKFVTQNASIPILKHYKGVCHIYVDEFAKIQEALQICINAKCSRPSVCNAAETILIHKKIADQFLPILKESLDKFKVEIFGCEKTKKIIKCKLATKQNYATEYLDFKINIKIVNSLEEALKHIEIYSSNHSEAIISENYSICEQFLNLVDSACVYANASTRFSDGGEFGFGAEIGISTDKLHARGPVGLKELTTYKYIIRGNGQIRI